jgi:large subunit ribosomal protein L21
MFAIVRTGGKQYKVQPGDSIRVEKLDSALGTELDLTDVLLVGGETTAVGTPTVKNAKVTVVVTKQTRDRKVIIFKKKRRQGYRRFKTHRQHFTELFVKAISLDGKVAQSEEKATVIDVDQVRMDRIQARTTDRLEAKKLGAKKEAAPKKAAKPAAKKDVKKAPAKKAAAKKKTAKKPAAKKTSKKA